MITKMTLGSLRVDEREKNLVIGDSNRSSGHTYYSHSKKTALRYSCMEDDFEKRRVLLDFFLSSLTCAFCFLISVLKTAHTLTHHLLWRAENGKTKAQQLKYIGNTHLLLLAFR